jgi:uncharacterized protein YcfJ
MNRIFVSVAAVTLAVVAQAAAADQGYYGRDYNDSRGRDYGRDNDYARVIDVQPLVEQVRTSVPVQQCWSEDRYDTAVRDNGNRTGATLFGGAAGALLGHQVRRGEGRSAATLGGALIGAVIGSQLGRNSDSRDYRDPGPRQVERCRTQYEDRYEDHVRAYRVTYVYNGRRQVTELPYDPGPRLRVAVRVQPLG